MNELGVSLLWLAVQITLLCGVVLALNVVGRRTQRPSASPTMIALLLTIALTATVFSPWPRWNRTVSEPTVTMQHQTGTVRSERLNAASDSANPELSIEGGTPASPEVAAESPVTAALIGFLAALRNELVSPGPRQSTSELRWAGCLAIAVIGAAAFGSLRLLIGWISVQRCVSRATPVGDPALRDALDILKAEMSCVRPVRLRESPELTSAAMVGWRRPVILLPTSWRGWSPGERRMVLAHELAHIESGDAAAWLVAQLVLLPHFYHPLVHWLVRGLRLQQELSADARAAQLTGGPRAYLKTLAELAVRQPDCSVAWPARAFLPTRGTFLRRIEMLRNTPVSIKRPSAWRRRALIAVTLATGLFVAGIRRPVSEQVTAAGPAAKPAAAAQAAAQSSKLILENVPAETVLLAAFRPAQLAAREELQPIAKFIEESLAVDKTGIGLKQIDQFLLIGLPRPGGDAGDMSAPVTELRTTSATDFKPYLFHQFGETTEQTVDGITLHARRDVSTTGHLASAWIVDDHTLIQGPAESILQLARSRRGGGKAPEWAAQLQAIENVPFGVGFDVRAIRPAIQRDFQRAPNPMLGMMSPLWQNTDVAVATAQINEKTDLTIHGWSTDEAGAEKVKQTITMLLPVANGMLQGSKASLQEMPADMREAVAKGIEVAENALNTAELTQDGKQVTLSLSGDGLSIATMAALVLPAVQQAREAARRVQSKNNLKQIILALHNYHDVNGHFPPAVLLGPDGKTQHSWRVAILPYVEPANLYQQYNMSEPWDSPDNLKVLAQIPPVFRHPNDVAGSTNASYFALIGEHTGFGNTAGSGNKMRSFTDGTATTIMVVEAKRDIPWTKPEDIPYSDTDPIPQLGGWHVGGLNVGVADGSVRLMSERVDETLLRNLIKRDDGNAVNF